MSQLVEAFRIQAQNCANLGSEFTAKICSLMGERLQNHTKVGAFLFSDDDPNYRANAVPLRLTGALHALVLQEREAALTAVYPPHTVSDDTLWTALENALHTHENHILHWLQSAPQTNEVRRSCGLIPGFHLIADMTGKPLMMSELGASAGLNMNWDRFGLNIRGQVWGDGESEVQLAPDWRGAIPPLAQIDVVDRQACDLNPLDVANPEDRLRLRSYLWPDQPDRIALTNAAIGLAQSAGRAVIQQDAIAFLENRLAEIRNGCAHVVYHSIMWQYLPADARRQGREAIYAAGERATHDAPLAWLRIEGDGIAGSAAITLTAWPSGITRQLGRCDYHGRWVEWF